MTSLVISWSGAGIIYHGLMYLYRQSVDVVVLQIVHLCLGIKLNNKIILQVHVVHVFPVKFPVGAFQCELASWKVVCWIL